VQPVPRGKCLRFVGSAISRRIGRIASPMQAFAIAKMVAHPMGAKWWIAVTSVAEVTLPWTIAGTTPESLPSMFATPVDLREIRVHILLLQQSYEREVLLQHDRLPAILEGQGRAPKADARSQGLSREQRSVPAGV